MSKHLLKQISAHFQTEFRPNEEGLSELKHKVLLALKSSESGFLKINGKQWSKSELLDLLESEISEDSFDFDALKEQYPSIQCVEVPSEISEPFDIKQLDLSSQDLLALQHHCSAQHFDPLYFSIRKDIEQHYFHRAEVKLSYLDLFEPIHKEEIMRKIQDQILLLIRFNNNTLKSVSFILKEPYYSLLVEMGTYDPSFMMRQFNEMGFWIRRMKPKQQSLFFDLQVQLPYLMFDLLQVKDSRDHYALINSGRQGEAHSTRWWQLAVSSIMLLIFIYYFMARKSKEPQGVAIPHDTHIKMQELRDQYGIDSDDNSDSIRMKLRQPINKQTE